MAGQSNVGTRVKTASAPTAFLSMYVDAIRPPFEYARYSIYDNYSLLRIICTYAGLGI